MITISNTIWQWLDKVDKEMFLKLNKAYTNNFLDTVLPWFRNSTNWIPLYIILLVWIIWKFRFKATYWLIAVGINAALSDQVSSNLIKKTVGRLRPCQDEEIKHLGRLLLPHCSGAYSFTSSHATNHFAAAMFIFLTVGSFFKQWKWLWFVWAAIISYAQVYVGVHYPFDVLCGALLGCLIGYTTAYFFTKKVNLQ